MNYGKFVGELNKGIEGRIVAYDDLEAGCVLHLNDGHTTVVVEPSVIDRQKEEAVSTLRACIRSDDLAGGQVMLALRGGALVFERHGDAA